MEEGRKAASSLCQSFQNLERMGPEQIYCQVLKIKIELNLNSEFHRFVLKRIKKDRKPVARTDSKLWRKQQSGANSDTR